MSSNVLLRRKQRLEQIADIIGIKHLHEIQPATIGSPTAKTDEIIFPSRSARGVHQRSGRTREELLFWFGLW
ncbi:MAG: hypothetical protein DWQ46_01035 [Planctomycetota bacterium]|nr:MAG: hypothetical protein DWQ46_01035 [Planctomycetota bacterium]